MEGIDALRGLCAILVVLQHFLPFYLLGSGIWPNRPLFYLDIGRVGVAAFFLISGYVIPFSIKPGAPPSAWRVFWIRRFFRLWPAYWVAILAAITFGADGAATTSALHDIINMTMLQQFLGIPNVLGVFWTLQIELCFYLCVTALLVCGLLHKERTQRVACLGWPLVALLTAVARGVEWHGLPLAMPIAFSLMFLSSEIRFRRRDQKPYPWIFIVYFAVTMVPICLIGYHPRYGSTDDPYRWLLAYFTAFILFLLFERIEKAPKVSVFLGTISYSVYLLHEVVISLISQIFGTMGLVERGFLILGATIVAASMCYQFVERPAQMLGRRLSGRDGTEKAIVSLASSP